MPQGELPCYEPPPNSPQRDKDDDKHDAQSELDAIRTQLAAMQEQLSKMGGKKGG